MAIDWKGIKREYEAGGASIAVLARKYGVEAKDIRRRVARDSWKHADDARSGKIAAPPKKRPPARKPRDITHEHRRLWKGVKKRLVSGLKSADLKTGLEELKVAKVAGEVLSSVIKGERDAWGLDEGRGERAEYDASEIISEMAALTVPRGTDEAVD